MRTIPIADKEGINEVPFLYLAEMFEPVLSKGLAKEDAYSALDDLADEILAKHQQLGVV